MTKEKETSAKLQQLVSQAEDIAKSKTAVIEELKTKHG